MVCHTQRQTEKQATEKRPECNRVGPVRGCMAEGIGVPEDQGPNGEDHETDQVAVDVDGLVVEVQRALDRLEVGM